MAREGKMVVFLHGSFRFANNAPQTLENHARVEPKCTENRHTCIAEQTSVILIARRRTNAISHYEYISVYVYVLGKRSEPRA